MRGRQRSVTLRGKLSQDDEAEASGYVVLMKRFIAVLISVGLMVGVGGCGGDESKSSDSSTYTEAIDNVLNSPDFSGDREQAVCFVNYMIDNTSLTIEDFDGEELDRDREEIEEIFDAYFTSSIACGLETGFLETQSSVQTCVPTLTPMVSGINNSERHLRTLKWELDDALYEMRLGTLDSFRLSGIDQSFRMTISLLDKASNDISLANFCDPYLTSLALGLSLDTLSVWDWAEEIRSGVEPNTFELENFESDLCDLIRATKIKYPELSNVTFQGEFSLTLSC